MTSRSGRRSHRSPCSKHGLFSSNGGPNHLGLWLKVGVWIIEHNLDQQKRQQMLVLLRSKVSHHGLQLQ